MLYGAVGAINESDVMLASASNAIIIGFQCRSFQEPTSWQKENIDILYRVIYNELKILKQPHEGNADPEFREVIVGHAEVRETLRCTWIGVVAGCYVTD